MAILLIITTFQLLSIDTTGIFKDIVYYQHNFCKHKDIYYIWWKINNLECVSTMDHHRMFLYVQ